MTSTVSSLALAGALIIPNNNQQLNAINSSNQSQIANQQASVSAANQASFANSSFNNVEEKVYKKEKQILLEFDIKTKGKYHHN